MIDWIIAQQGMLSVTLTLLIITEHFLHRSSAHHLRINYGY